MGVLGTVLLMLVAYPYTKFIVKYVENVYCVLAIAPSIFFCCCMSTYRGYYEGMQNMVPTAISEVIEVVGNNNSVYADHHPVVMGYGIETKGDGKLNVYGGSAFRIAVTNDFAGLSGVAPPVAVPFSPST